MSIECFKCHTPLPDDSRFCSACGVDVSGSGAEHTMDAGPDAEIERMLRQEIASDFVVERELGRGGMAAVFLATDVQLGRKVAVKVLPPELTFGTSLVERFKREARTAATLDHPNIIPIYRVSTSGKLCWYAMKYLDGEALSDILKREGFLPPARAASIIDQVADALEYAHARGIIHRDIKPANIMLDARDRVTVTDFGIAKAVDTGTLTGSGSMIGTPYYMSPEQCAGKKTITGAADQYSLGVMAYQMISGHLPFTGESVIDIIKQHCMDPVPPLGVLRPDLPSALAAVVEKALAKSAEDRYSCVLDFARAFAASAQGATSGLGLDPVPPSPSVRSSTTLVAVGGSAAVGGGVAPSQRRISDTTPIRAASRTFRPFDPASVPPRRSVRTPLVLGGIAVLGVAVVVVTQLRFFGPGASVDQTASTERAPVSAPTPALPVRDTTVQSPQVAAASTPPAEARLATPVLTLQGVLPPGAIIMLNGGRVADGTLQLLAGRRNDIAVIAAGYQPWTDVITPRPGERLTRTPQLRRLPPSPPAVTGGATPGADEALLRVPDSAPSPAARDKKLSAAAAPYAALVPATALITVGSRPGAQMMINGRATPTNPVSRYEVPAGVVRLRFIVTDAAGPWTVDTTVNVAGGETRSFGYIRLRRP